MVSGADPMEKALAGYLSAIAEASTEFEDAMSEAGDLIREICGDRTTETETSSAPSEITPPARSAPPGIFDA